MKKVTVDITQDMLDTAIKSQVQELEKAIKKLKSQNAQLKRENERYRDQAARVQMIIEAINDAGFYEGYC